MINEKMKREHLNIKNNNKSNMARISQKWLELLVLFSYEYDHTLFLFLNNTLTMIYNF